MKIITRVNSRILMHSPYIWISVIFWKWPLQWWCFTWKFWKVIWKVNFLKSGNSSQLSFFEIFAQKWQFWLGNKNFEILWESSPFMFYIKFGNFRTTNFDIISEQDFEIEFQEYQKWKWLLLEWKNSKYYFHNRNKC